MSELDTQVKPAANQTGTAYVVLRLNTDSDEWIEHGDRVRATSATAAIREHVGRNTSQEGAYVAIPARSWKPVSVKAEQTTVLKLEQAT